MVICWYVSNVSEALVGAVIVRRLGRRGTSHGAHRLVFCRRGRPSVSSRLFLDAGFVRLVGWGSAVSYWSLWEARFFANILATLIFVPVVVTCVAGSGRSRPRATDRLAWIEAAAAAGRPARRVSVAIFDSGVDRAAPLAEPALPAGAVPGLGRAALRAVLDQRAFAIVAFLVIWGAPRPRAVLCPRTHTTPCRSSCS